MSLVWFLVLALITSQGCALRFQTPAKPVPVASTHHPSVNPKRSESVASNKNSSEKKCPDRVDGARVGSLTGTILGTIVGSAFGMPWLGIVYKFAGAAMGFAAGNTCGQKAVPEKNGKWVKPTDQTTQGNEEQDGKNNEAVEPVLQPPRGIKEENI
jgi:hypothetical protein